MHGKERSAIFSLSMIMSFRMLGLFMILPIFSVAAAKLPGSTPTLIGLALGIYGLTQALLQIPFGMLSDRIGRKPVIAGGLVLFAIGSIVAALSHSLEGLILGRALQGAGAIGSTTLAMVADLTRDEHRSKAMAFIGLTIGFSFTIAMVLGPIINAWLQLSGIFWITAGLALFGILLLFTSVPKPPKLTLHPDVETEPKRFKNILKNKQLLRLDVGIFSLHAILTAMFIAIPLLLTHTIKLSEVGQVILYLVVLTFAFFTMVPLIIISEKKRKMKSIFVGAIIALTIAEILLFVDHHTAISIGIILLLFFSAFTLLEASLPSLVSKIAPIRQKGTAMGVYSSSQFFGIFVGGTLGGWVIGQFGIEGVFLLCALLAFIWIFVAITMAHPPYLSTLIYPLPKGSDQEIQQLTQRLRKLSGVSEIVIMASEKLLYLKVDKKIVTKHELRKWIEEGNLQH